MGIGSSLAGLLGGKGDVSMSPVLQGSSNTATSANQILELVSSVNDETLDDEIDDIEQKFYNNVRDYIIFFLFFLSLFVISWSIIRIFKKDKDEASKKSEDDDESLVHSICFWICVFALAISMGATLLLPISIVANEVRLLYPKTYYVQWLNETLIQGLWNLIFLFSNLSIFVLLPFAHLFIESEGFSGHKKGLAGKFHEAVVVLLLSGFACWGLSHVISALLSSGSGNILRDLLNVIRFPNQLPFIYSCISFFGVLLLLVCIPLGATRVFTVLSQLLVGPQFLRNLEDEYKNTALGLECLQYKLLQRQKNEERITQRILNTCKDFLKSNRSYHNSDEELKMQDKIIRLKSRWKKLEAGEKDDCIDDMDSKIIESQSPEFLQRYRKIMPISPNVDDSINMEEKDFLEKIELMKNELLNLERLMKTPGWKRNILYPFAFVIVLVLTALTVCMVIINTLQLVVGLKSLPINPKNFSLGLSSISILGPWGAGLEVISILYLITTSIIGLYGLPGVRNVTPQVADLQTSKIIYNCILVLILSSALPLLSRILGITNFDLLGNFGKIEWLGNFYIVFLYNVIFSVATTLCLVNKFTLTIREELLKRLKNIFQLVYFKPLFVTHEASDGNGFPCSPSKHGKVGKSRRVKERESGGSKSDHGNEQSLSNGLADLKKD